MKFSWQKLVQHILYPHLAVIICLLPISIAFLVLSLVYLTTTSVLAILSYMLAFYLLVVVCLRIPRIVAYFKRVKNENKFLKRWFEDVHFRMNLSLYGSLIWNIAFAVFQLCLGFYHNSMWFYAMFGYYTVLGLMRFFLVKHTRVYKANEQIEFETKKYILCGWLLLSINLALTIIVILSVVNYQAFGYGMITTISLAAYTFVTFTFAIINKVKYKKYNSSVYSAAKTISFIAACVSMLTLETSMIATFGKEASLSLGKILIPITGAVVLGIVITMAIVMIIKGTKKLNSIKKELSS